MSDNSQNTDPVTLLVSLFSSKLDNLDRNVNTVVENDRLFGERLARIEAMQVGNAKDVAELRDDLRSTKTDLKVQVDKNSKLESRVVRLETLIVPGMSLIAALASAFIGHYVK
jgi:hypothetical protein